MLKVGFFQGDLIISDESYLEHKLPNIKSFSFIKEFKNELIVNVETVNFSDSKAVVIHLFNRDIIDRAFRIDGDDIELRGDYKHIEMGCDTASYTIYATNYIQINTLADGYYGEAFVSKNVDEAMIILSEVDYMPIEELFDKVCYTFNLQDEDLLER